MVTGLALSSRGERWSLCSHSQRPIFPLALVARRRGATAAFACSGMRLPACVCAQPSMWDFTSGLRPHLSLCEEQVLMHPPRAEALNWAAWGSLKLWWMYVSEGWWRWSLRLVLMPQLIFSSLLKSGSDTAWILDCLLASMQVYAPGPISHPR